MNYIWNLTDLEKVPKNGRKVFSCFSCGGGSSMGYKLAGFTVVGNCEIDPKINAMYKKNHHPKYNYEMGVQDFYKLPDIPDELKDIDILDGSPPCSTFSMAGERDKNWGKEKKFREGQAEQVLDDLFFEFLKVAEVLKPKIIVAENVKGLITGKARGYVNLILKRYEELGYDAQVFLLNAATMGVPQRRERVFIIGRRKDLGFDPLVLNFNEKPIVYGEFADSDWKPINQDSMTYKRWQKRKPSDNKLADTVARTEPGKVSGFTEPYVKLDRVVTTVTAGGGMLRYDVPGYVNDRDISIIQTFPQDYDYNGNPVKYVCGMSVPPLMMYGIANEINRQWFGEE